MYFSSTSIVLSQPMRSKLSAIQRSAVVVAEPVQMLEERALGVHLAERAHAGQFALRADLMKAHGGVAVVVQLAAFHQAGDGGDARHLAHQAGVEGHFVDAVEDVARGDRHLVAHQRVDLHDHHVARGAFVDQRIDRGIAEIAAVPIELAVDLHRLEQERQAGRRHHGIGRQFRRAEQARLAGPDVGGGDEQLHVRSRAQAFEIHLFFQQVAQRVDLHRIELGRRPHAAHEVEHHEGGIVVDRPAVADSRNPAHDAAGHAGKIGDAAPEPLQPVDRALAPAFEKSIGEHHGVHGAGAGAADPVDIDVRIAHQPVHDAPGEGAMRPAALQRQADALHARLQPAQRLVGRAVWLGGIRHAAVSACDAPDQAGGDHRRGC